MRVLLLRPPRRHSVQRAVPRAVADQGASSPPLGLLALATWLRERTDHEVVLVDAEVEGLHSATLATRLAAISPDVVGVSALTVQLVDVVHAVEVARGVDGVSRVVLGGPHVYDFPAEAVGLPGVDAVVRGEGEAALPALLDAWAAGRGGQGLPGVMVSGDERVPDPVVLDGDLDAYPVVDRSPLDSSRYYDVMGRGGALATVVTSRGCPHRCAFCNTPRHHHRTMSAARICLEVEHCLAQGAQEIAFLDDTFNVSRRRVVELCQAIHDRDLDFCWSARARVQGIDADLATRMRAAGCLRLQLGVEQGTEEGLERLRKDITLAEVDRAFASCRAAGIETVAYFMVGTPTERNREAVRATVEAAIRLDPDWVMFNLLTPFPGTPLFDEGVAGGVIDPEPWQRFLTRPTPEFQAPLWTEHFGVGELDALLAWSWRRFYRRPGYILRRLARVRSRRDLARKARAGRHLLLG